MKTLLSFIAVACLVISTNAQNFQNLDKIQPEEEYENILVKKLHSDEEVTSFIIWVKKSVKAHKHELHAEHVYVLEGEAKMWVGEEEQTISRGDMVYIPVGAIHKVEVTSETPLKVLSVQAPEFKGKDRVFVEDDTSK